MATDASWPSRFPTRDWAKAVAFWQALGFEVAFANDDRSGMLRHPAGGHPVFLAKPGVDDPVASVIHLPLAETPRPESSMSSDLAAPADADSDNGARPRVHRRSRPS